MKVFLTVGSMLPFDRLVHAMDSWAQQNPQAQVRAQIGEGAWEPSAFPHQAMLTPGDYRAHCEWADVIVSHVGMGTVITAAELRRPLVAMPRLAAKGEVTSDHQSASAHWLSGRAGIIVVTDETGLDAAIESASRGFMPHPTGDASRERLIAVVRRFLLDAGAGESTTRLR